MIVRIEFHMLAIVPIDEINMARIFHLMSFSAWRPNLIFIVAEKSDTKCSVQEFYCHRSS